MPALAAAYSLVWAVTLLGAVNGAKSLGRMVKVRMPLPFVR